MTTNTILQHPFKGIIYEDPLSADYLYSLSIEGKPSQNPSENHWLLLFELFSKRAPYIHIGLWNRPKLAEELKERFNCVRYELYCEVQEEMLFEATPVLIDYLIETLKTPEKCEWFNLGCAGTLEALDSGFPTKPCLSTGHMGEECYAYFMNADEVENLISALKPEALSYVRVERFEHSKQENAIHRVLKSVKQDPAVRAVFLKGSLAKGEGDAYSDVDFYCLVHEAQESDFLTRRIKHLQAHWPLLYHSEVNHVCPQIVGYFMNNLHFDLYTVTENNLSQTGAMKVLYDPEELLVNYKAQDLSITQDEYFNYFDELSFILVEYEAAYLRGDLIWAARLAQHASGYVSMIFRYLTDPKQARLGMKRLHQYNDPADQAALSDAMEYLGPSTSLKGLKMLLQLTASVIERYPETLTDWENQYFFEHMSNRIFNNFTDSRCQ